VPTSEFEIKVQMEQASKGLDDAVDKAIKLEQRLADVTKRLGENNQATKTTKFWYDKANAAAEALWIKQSRELNKIEGSLKRVGSSIDRDLVGGINKFGEAVDRAGKRFDTSISSKFKKMEDDLKRAERDSVIGPLKKWRQENPEVDPIARKMAQQPKEPTPKTEFEKEFESRKIGKDPFKNFAWSSPKEKATTDEFKAESVKASEGAATFWGHVKGLFTEEKEKTSGRRRESQFINALGNTARVGAGASGGGAHYGFISGITGLLKQFFMAPGGMQLVETVAAGALLAIGTAVGLAEPVARRSRQARGYGQAYGAFEAAEYSIGPYRDVNAGMAATRMAMDPTSQARIAQIQLGLNPQTEGGKSGPAQLADQNIALKKLMDRFKDFGQFLAYFNNTALKDMFSPDDVFRIKKATESQLEQGAKEAAQNEKLLDLGDDTAQVYTDLNKHLGLFGQVLETVAAKNLVGLASAIDKIIIYLTNAPFAKQEREGHANPNPFSEWLWKPFGGQPNTWDKNIGKENPLISKPSASTDKLLKGLQEAPLVPQFQTGAYSVPDTGMAMLHQDELVMPAKEASAFRNMLANTTTEGGKDFGEFNKELMKSSDIFVDLNKEIKPLADNMSALNMELTSGKYLAERYGGGEGGGGGGDGAGPVAFKDMVGGGGAPLAPGGGGGGGIFPSVTGEKATPLMQEAGKGFGGRDPRPGATAKQNAAIVADVFRKAGASEEGIAGMMANIQSESAFKGGATEAGGTGVGLWQFSGTSANSEKGRFLAAMKEQGKDWRDPKAQAEYQIENLQKNYPNVWKEMQTHAAAGQQAADYLLGYERPKGTRIIDGKPVATGSYALQRQQEYLGGVPSVSSYTGGDGGGITTGGGKAPAFVGSASSQGGATGHWADDLKKMKDNGLITSPQCVALASAAVGIKSGAMREGGHVGDWRPGEDVMSGDIKPGTPISTFLDREGKQSGRYAGGGIGTMGARLDHAAEFLKYLTDEKGKRTGMEVLEQYKGSGPHVRDYYDNPVTTGDYRNKNVRYSPGFGENNARNYRAIKVASGGYIGDDANPMTRDAIAKRDETMKTAAAAYSPTTKEQMAKIAAAYGPPNRPQMQASAQPGRVDPYGRDPTPHLGDMSQFHKDASPVVTIFNKSGSNVNLQTASIGSAQGNFDS
jgi:hypothetical protein